MRLGDASGGCVDAVGGAAGTYTNAPTLGAAGLIASDPTNTSVNFDGTNDHVSFADRAAFDRGDVFTLEAWIYMDAIGRFNGIMDKGSGAYVFRVGTDNRLLLRRNSVQDIVKSTITLAANTLYHVVATKNGATVKLYVNGVDVTGTVTNSTMVNTSIAFNIAAADAGSTDFFDGRIDEVAVYPTALSAARVLAHYQAGLVTPIVVTPPASAVVAITAGVPTIVVDTVLSPTVATVAVTGSSPTIGATGPDETVTPPAAGIANVSASAPGVTVTGPDMTISPPAAAAVAFVATAPGIAADVTVAVPAAAVAAFVASQPTIDVAPVAPPVDVVTSAATGIGASSATLNGSVDVHGVPGKWAFQYVTQAQFALTGWVGAHLAPVGPAFADIHEDGSTPVSQLIGALTPDTVYRYRLVARQEYDPGGTLAVGDEETFETSLLPPRLVDPPIAIFPEIVKPDGTRYRWDPAGPADSVPGQPAFSTKRMEGFSEATVVLPRRIDGEYADIERHDDFNLIDATGRVVWEGRVADAPRELGADGHSIQVAAVGWMAHGRDKSFRDVIVDHDISRWTGPSVQRQANLAALNSWSVGGPSVEWDEATKQAALRLQAQGPWTAVDKPHMQGWYDAGPGVDLGELYFAWKKSPNIDHTSANWSWQTGIVIDDTGVTGDLSSELRAAGPGSGSVAATAAGRRYGYARLSYPGGAGGGDNAFYNLFFTCLAAIGRHGLTKRGVADLTIANGYYASDVLRYLIERYCPRLNADGVLDTTYPMRQIAWHDLTDPYDAFLDINAPHFWELACWEDKTVHFGPADLTDYDWQVRVDDPGVTINLPGDEEEASGNGIIVEYEDSRTGTRQILTPEDYPELRDTNPANPANRHGLEVWGDPVRISIPVTLPDALQIGRAMLAERNQAKAAGTINIEGGYIRDRAGNWQPTAYVRSSDTIAVVNHPNARPRLIHETRWSERKLIVAVDSTIKRIDAYINRVAGMTGARNLVAP